MKTFCSFLTIRLHICFALFNFAIKKNQYDTIKPDVFTETAFRSFMTHLCPRPEIYEIFTS